MGTELEATELELPAELVIQTVAEVKEQLNELLDAGADTVALRAMDVSRVDTAGIQLLYAFAREAVERGIAVQWDEPSESLSDAARDVGWVSAFGSDCDSGEAG